jgi:DNA-binding response OmpR family regulator
LRKEGFDRLIIGVTGNVFEEDVKDYMDAGVDMVLSKPLRMDVLMLLLKHVNENGTASIPKMTLSPQSNTLMWVEEIV